MTPYYDEDGITIWHADCRDVLPTLDHASLLIFDPPYNVGKKYDGYDDNLPPAAYAEWLSEVLTAAKADTLTWFPGALGTLDLLPVIASTPWAFERLLAWHKKEYAGDMFGCGPAMCWEPIVWAHRGERVFNRVFGAWGRDLLVVNSTHGDPLRAVHPCPKPPEVMRWLIGLFCAPDGVVLDPTMGAGTTLVEARRHGRKAIGIEQSERYCELAVSRLAQGVLAL